MFMAASSMTIFNMCTDLKLGENSVFGFVPKLHYFIMLEQESIRLVNVIHNTLLYVSVKQ